MSSRYLPNSVSDNPAPTAAKETSDTEAAAAGSESGAGSGPVPGGAAAGRTESVPVASAKEPLSSRTRTVRLNLPASG